MRTIIKLFTQKALFLLLISLAGASYAQIPQIERDALIALYNSTDGANWTDKTGWLGSAGTECVWYGITCSSGAVSAISLYDNSLTGSIPAELGNLTNLTNLTLSVNSLTGSIPAELGNLTNLTNLYLGSNSLSGNIPAELSNLTNLTGLRLGDNSLSGSVPAELGNLENLTGLYLNSNSLTGSIPVEINNLTNLKSFFLDSNSLSGSIPAELGNLENLTALYLHGNSLTGSIPAELSKLANLDALYLNNNSLTGSIPSELGNLLSLTYLGLHGNSLTGSIPAELGNLKNLTYLSLYGNSLSGGIPAELGNLTNLITLYLNSNLLTGSIPVEINNLTNLNSLYLNSNSLTGPLPQWLSDMSIPILSVIDAFVTPVVTISEGNRKIADTNDAAGELVSFTATIKGMASSNDGSTTIYQWSVDGVEVATGLSATLKLLDGSNTVTFKATDKDGAVYSASVDVQVGSPYVPTSTWPSAYNGVSPDSKLNLSLNNVGIYESFTGFISSCVSVYTNNELDDASDKLDILFYLLDDSAGDIQYADSRVFNEIEKLPADGQSPDCSGKYETTTNIYSDTLETRLTTELFGVSLPINKTFNVSFQLIDSSNLIFRLTSYEELTAP